MIGPTVDTSTEDGELVADAAALTTGALLGGVTLDGSELKTSLAEAGDGAVDETTGALVATEAAWCDPEHAASSRLTTTADVDQTNPCRRMG